MTRQNFIRVVSLGSEEKILEEIGFDSSYLSVAKNKYIFKLIKITDLSIPQANIIKQTCLSVGADAAVNKNVITGKIEFSDLMIGATLAQYKEIIKKLAAQPFSLSVVAKKLQQELNSSLTPIKIRNKLFDWENNTYLMGILNVTPDSFSDGGNFFDEKTAILQAESLILDGADIIDVGGESTRPFAQSVDVDEEIKRVIPIIKAIRNIDADIPISIDTRNSKTADFAINAGADIINDVSGFDWDAQMMYVAKDLNVPIVVQHSLSSPDKMQSNPEYDGNVVSCVFNNLAEKIDKACEFGISKENIIADVGIGFGKTIENNYELIKRADEFKSLGCALLYGVSRKSLITKVLEVDVTQTEEANLALATYLAVKKVNILRVHNVASHKKILKVLKYL